MTEAAQAPTDDLEIEIEDPEIEVGEEEEGVASSDATPKEPAKAVSAEDGIAEFKAQLEAKDRKLAEEGKARREAEERAAENERKANANQGQAHNSQYQQVLAALDSVAHKNTLTKREYAEALRSGDYDKVAELQGEIAEQASALLQLKQTRAQWDAYFKNPQPQRQQAQQRPADPVEAMASQIAQQGSPRSADWIRKNPDYARDDVLRAEMVAAHGRAVREGHTPDSDSYFEFINKRLGLDKSETKEPRKPPQHAAPATRQAATPSPASNKITIRLSKEQRDLADDLGQPHAVFAANVARAIKQGRISQKR